MEQVKDTYRVTITWQENTRKPGEAIAFVKTGTGSIPVFPSVPNYLPIRVPEARPRFTSPQAGETEDCILKLNQQGNAYHAYPVGGLELKECAGVFVLPASHDDNSPEGVLTLMYECHACAWEDGGVTYFACVPKKLR